MKPTENRERYTEREPRQPRRCVWFANGSGGTRRSSTLCTFVGRVTARVNNVDGLRSVRGRTREDQYRSKPFSNTFHHACNDRRLKRGYQCTRPVGHVGEPTEQGSRERGGGGFGKTLKRMQLFVVRPFSVRAISSRSAVESRKTNTVRPTRSRCRLGPRAFVKIHRISRAFLTFPSTVQCPRVLESHPDRSAHSDDARRGSKRFPRFRLPSTRGGGVRRSR